jgi:arylsulfatase
MLSIAGVSAQTRQERHPQLRGFDLSSALQNPSGHAADGRSAVLFNMVRPAPLPAADTGTGSSVRTCLQGVFDGRWKFARYSAPEEYGATAPLHVLLAAGDVELYDVTADPHESVNLACEGTHSTQVGVLDRLLDDLVTAEAAEMSRDDPELNGALTPRPPAERGLPR